MRSAIQRTRMSEPRRASTHSAETADGVRRLTRIGFRSARWIAERSTTMSQACVRSAIRRARSRQIRYVLRTRAPSTDHACSTNCCSKTTVNVWRTQSSELETPARTPRSGFPTRVAANSKKGQVIFLCRSGVLSLGAKAPRRPAFPVLAAPRRRQATPNPS